MALPVPEKSDQIMGRSLIQNVVAEIVVDSKQGECQNVKYWPMISFCKETGFFPAQSGLYTAGSLTLNKW